MKTKNLLIPRDEIRITVEALPEYERPEDCFDFEECEKEIARIKEEREYNDWAWCCVKVTATWRGLSVSDTLGACSYKNEAAFRECGYFQDMQLRAIDDLQIRFQHMVLAATSKE